MNIEKINLIDQDKNNSVIMSRQHLVESYNKFENPISMPAGLANTMYTSKNLKSSDQAPHFDNPILNFKIDENEIAELSDMASDSNEDSE